MIKLTRKNFIKTGLFGGIFAGLINQKNTKFMPRKSKLNQMSQTHGEVVQRQPSSLSQLLGYEGLSEYKFLTNPFDENEYEKYLNNQRPPIWPNIVKNLV